MLRVELDRAEWRGGDTVRARIVGEGPVEWKLYRWCRGEQAATDDEEVVARGKGVATAEGLAVDVTLPVGAAPSHPGDHVRVTWRLDAWPEGRRVPAPGEPDEEVRTPLRVVAGPAPRKLDPWIAAWGRARASERRERGVAVGLLALLALAGLGVLGAMGVAAVTLPLLPALGLSALIGLVTLGGVVTLRERLPGALGAARSRARLHVAPAPVALLGGAADIVADTDTRRAMVGNGYTWTLRCVERAARRVTWVDRGTTRTRYDWSAKLVHEATGAVTGPPYGRRIFPVSIPREAPPTLIADYRRIAWEIELRCGDDVVIEPIFVAPFVEA